MEYFEQLTLNSRKNSPGLTNTCGLADIFQKRFFNAFVTFQNGVGRLGRTDNVPFEKYKKMQVSHTD